MRSPRSRRPNRIERGSANSAYARRAHNAAYAELRISGDPSPSADDVQLTGRLVAAGVLLGVDVLDHIIVGDGRYYSFKEGSRL
jgi:DNA repair protein RadC